MKNKYYSRLGIGLAGLALAWSGGVCSANVQFADFDDTNSVDATHITGFVGTAGALAGSTYSWDSSQNSPATNQAVGSGSMYVTIHWVNNSGTNWQDAQINTPGLSNVLSQFQYAAWDMKPDPLNSFVDMGGAGYGDFYPIYQHDGYAWGSGSPLTHISTNVAWQHVQIGIPVGYALLDQLIYCWVSPQNTAEAATNKTSFWFDAFRFLSPSGTPPRMSFGGNAKQGLNFWTDSQGQFDRHEIYVDGNAQALSPWVILPATYSFTISDFPTNAADSGYSFIFGIVAGPGGNNGAPDWHYDSVIYTGIQCDTNGIATWVFRWKTNWPESNGNTSGGLGNYYVAGLPNVTNPTPIGKWTMEFLGDAVTVRMTAPNGNTNTFQLGVWTNTVDLASSFSSGGSIFLDVMANNTNNSYKRCVLSRFSVSGFPFAGFTNDWTTSTLDTNIWKVDAGDAIYSIFPVPVSTGYYLKWNVPDVGFALQTNNNAKIGWSTNGVPNAEARPLDDLSHTSIIIETNKYLLITPANLPAANPKGIGNLLFRLARPGF